MKKHLQIGNWSHFSGEARQPNGDPRLITNRRMNTIQYSLQNKNCSYRFSDNGKLCRTRARRTIRATDKS